jgi:hypothetical protein
MLGGFRHTGSYLFALSGRNHFEDPYTCTNHHAHVLNNIYTRKIRKNYAISFLHPQKPDLLE